MQTHDRHGLWRSYSAFFFKVYGLASLYIRDMHQTQKAGWSKRSGPLAVMGLALLVRLIYLWVYQGMPDWTMLTVDNFYHHHWAQVIAGGEVIGDTTYFRAPLYIWCLSSLYAVFGDGLWVGRLFGLAIGLGSVYMTYRIGRRLVSPAVGIVAGLIHALFPIAIYFESELLLDPLFTLLLQFAVYRALGWWQSKGIWLFVSSGLLFGLASICRPTALVWVVVLALLPPVLYGWRSGMQRAALFLGGVLLVIAPITIRNIAVAGDPVMIASQAGVNFYIGNNDSADGLTASLPEPLGHNWRIADVVYIAEKELGRELTPGEVSGYWNGHTLEWIWRNPGRFTALYLKKIYFSFSNREISNNRDLPLFFSRVALLKYNPLGFGVVFGFGLVGAFLLWRQNSSARWLAVTVLLAVLAGALFFFSSRFRLPLLPWFFVFAAAGGVSIWNRRGNMAKLVTPIAVLLVGGLFSYTPLVALPSSSMVQSALVRGSHYYAAGHYELAREWYTAARDADEAFPEVNLDLGTTFLRLGEADSARYFFERELAFHPDRAAGYANLASLYLVDGNPSRARQYASEALARRPYDVMAARIMIRASAADSTVSNGDLLTLIHDMAAQTNNDIFLLNDAARLLATRGIMSPADSIFAVADSVSPPPIEMDDTAFDREFRNSRENWRRARAESAFQRGYLAGLRGDLQAVIEYSQKAITLDSTKAEAYINLAGGYYRSGRQSAADSVMTDAERRFGRDALNRFMLR